MNNLIQDLKYAVRGLAKARGFAIIAILTLAFALGANTAIFSVVSAILLQPLPFEQPQELMLLEGKSPRWTSNSFSFPNYSDIRTQSKTIEHASAYTAVSSFLYQTGSEPERVRGAMATHDLWPLLNVKPLLGRGFNQQEDTFGQAPVVVISEGLWRRRFGSDPGIVGKQVRLGATPKTVVGVMPHDFKFPPDQERPEFWMSLGQEIEDGSSGRGAIWMYVLARLRDGVTVEQANADLATIGSRLEK